MSAQEGGDPEKYLQFLLDDLTSSKVENRQDTDASEEHISLVFNRDSDEELRLAQQHNKIHAERHESLCRWVQVYTIPIVFLVVIGWLIVVQILMFHQGFGWTNITDSTMVAYLTTTTINVIGLMSVIMYWLFPKK